MRERSILSINLLHDGIERAKHGGMPVLKEEFSSLSVDGESGN